VCASSVAMLLYGVPRCKAPTSERLLICTWLCGVVKEKGSAQWALEAALTRGGLHTKAGFLFVGQELVLIISLVLNWMEGGFRRVVLFRSSRLSRNKAVYAV
jgi:hypothetical protein